MWKLCIKYKHFFIFGIFFIALTSFIQISFEFLKGALLDSAVEKNFDKVLSISILFFCAFLIKAYTHFLYTRFYFKGKIAVLGDTRKNFITHLLDFSYPFFNKRNKGEYEFKYIKELDMIEHGLFQSWYGLMQIIFEILFAFSGLIMINYKLAALSFLLLFLPVVLPKCMEKILNTYQKLTMDTLSDHIAQISEWISTFEIIKNYAATENFKTIFDKENKKVYAVNLKNDAFYAFTQTLSKLLSQIGLLGIITASAILIAKGEISIGALIISIGIMEELQSQVIHIAYYIQQLVVTKVPLHSIKDFMESGALVTGTYSKPPETIDTVKEVRFNNVSFSYNVNDKPLFERISLSAHKKGLYLIQGESGCGKSTLMNLLLHYDEPRAGSIVINDIHVKNIANVTKLITVFRQEAVFFDNSLRENIRAYQNIDDNTVIELLKKLKLNRFAAKAALDDTVFKNGASFSGGEARRLNLARSLLRKSDILILDEPFANIDEDTVNIIAKIIAEIKDRYVFLITHQLPSKTELQFQKILAM